MNFVFVSLQRINTDRDSTSTCLARELSKNHKVLYVNSPIDRRTLYSQPRDKYIAEHIRNLKDKNKCLEKIQDNLWVLNPPTIIESINWIPVTAIFKVLNWFNNKRFAGDISEVIVDLGFEDFILINDKDIFRSFYLKELLKPDKYVYLDRDYTVGMDYWKRHGVDLEPQLMKKADAVVCNSNDFVKRAKLYNSNSFYIGNGYNADQYLPGVFKEQPFDLQQIPRPRIGYIGAIITLRLDLQLLTDIAARKPEWNFVFIGWEDEGFAKSRLHSLPNVFFLGKKHTSQIPQYLQYFDACINPQVVNSITSGNFPLKVVEYLAMEKPVVATETSTMKEVFEQHVFLARDEDTFIDGIERALKESTQKATGRRRAFVSQFSWENVTSRLLNCINRISK